MIIIIIIVVIVIIVNNKNKQEEVEVINKLKVELTLFCINLPETQSFLLFSINVPFN